MFRTYKAETRDEYRNIRESIKILGGQILDCRVCGILKSVDGTEYFLGDEGRQLLSYKGEVLTVSTLTEEGHEQNTDFTFAEVTEKSSPDWGPIKARIEVDAKM